MQVSIQEVLEKRILAYQNNTLEKQFELDGKEYQKKWAEAVQHFKIRINKQRFKEKKPELPFMAIRQKLVAVKEVDDLRWFYGECIKYENKRDKFGRRIPDRSFNRCFFGALK